MSAAGLQDAGRAETLYRLLLPYAGVTVVVGATVCLGATSRYLGQLATTSARWKTAEAHSEHALDLSDAWPRRWIAHTQLQYARS